MIDEISSIDLSRSSGRSRTVRTKTMISKVKRKPERGKVSNRKLALELDISRTSARRILREDLGCRPYMTLIEPFISDQNKIKRKQFANWIQTNFRKEETLKILFSDEKTCDIYVVYNSQNDRICTINRTQANRIGGLKQKRQFSQKVMVWLGACCNGTSPLVISEEGTLDHARCIDEVLHVVLKYGNKTFGDEWTFQQDVTKPHIHHLTQEWCRNNFPSFINEDHRSAHNPDLNLLLRAIQK